MLMPDVLLAVNRARAEQLGLKVPHDVIEAAKVVYHELPATRKE